MIFFSNFSDSLVSKLHGGQVTLHSQYNVLPMDLEFASTGGDSKAPSGTALLAAIVDSGRSIGLCTKPVIIQATIKLMKAAVQGLVRVSFLALQTMLDTSID